ncbi:MAG: 50S ribosomal protein L17 [Desulfonatronovibrio sp.]
MRHRKSGKKLGRTWEHRKAMFRNMAKSLIVYEKIRTTVPKAKEMSKIMDKLITLAIRNDLNARRQAYKILENHKLVQKLFNEIGPKFTGGQGGYTRVVKFAAPRVGDSAAMAVIEFAYGAGQKDLPAAEPAEPAVTKPSPKKEIPPVPAESPEAKVSEEPVSQESSSEEGQPDQTEDAEAKAAAPDTSTEAVDPEQAGGAQEEEIPDKESK